MRQGFYQAFVGNEFLIMSRNAGSDRSVLCEG